MKTNSEIAAIVKNVNVSDKAVIMEIKEVVIEIRTKDGDVTRQTIKNTELSRTLSMYQTFGNCIGFPAARDADFAAVRSALNRPTKLMKDYLAGHLDGFFESRYSKASWDTRVGRTYLRIPVSYKKDVVYSVGKSRSRFELELSMCEYLYGEKMKAAIALEKKAVNLENS